MSYTPGPWEVRERWYIAKVGNSMSHAEVKCCLEIPATAKDEHEANARLMAAAPDLLEACKAMVARLENDLLDTSLFDDVHAKLRDAIAKAEDPAQPLTPRESP